MATRNNTAEPVRTGTMPHRRVDDRARELSREKVASLPAEAELASPETMRAMVHQLQVHQIELETQNEELRRTQWELEAARSRYFNLYDLAPVGYCTLSEHSLILDANLMAATLFDCSRGTLENQRISNFIFAADQDIYYLHRQQLLASGDPQSFEVRIVKNAGIHCWVKMTVTYEKDADDATLIRIIMTDISASKLIEAERLRVDQMLHDYTCDLERATAIAEHATSVAEKANLAKSEFLSSMSHELRTPLSAILGFAQLIDSGTPPPTPTQKRNIDQILRAGWYLLDLINEILDLALIESGKLSLSLEPVVLADVLRDCQTMIETQAQKHAIQINFTGIDAPHLVHADRTRLKQILINLLSNAIKYNRPAGRVTVHCIQQPLGRLRICVTDTGEGLAPGKIAQLFQPFNRLGQENNEVEGTGIGLVMTKRLIELMGGEIGLESELGVGSVFWVELHLSELSPTLHSETTVLKKPSIENPISDATTKTTANATTNPTPNATINTATSTPVSNPLAITQVAINQVAINEAAVNQAAINEVATNQVAINTEALNKTSSSTVEMPPLDQDGDAGLPLQVAPQTLLYVEDNPANLLLIEEIMARRPAIRLLTALDGISGIALARAAQPNVILMDINLPGISGTLALKILAAEASTAHIPVIALSANAIPSDIEKGLQAGFFCYLTKPIKINEFMTTLDKALAHVVTH